MQKTLLEGATTDIHFRVDSGIVEAADNLVGVMVDTFNKVRLKVSTADGSITRLNSTEFIAQISARDMRERLPAGKYIFQLKLYNDKAYEAIAVQEVDITIKNNVVCREK